MGKLELNQQNKAGKFMCFKFNYTVKTDILDVLFEVPKTAIRNL